MVAKIKSAVIVTASVLAVIAVLTRIPGGMGEKVIDAAFNK